MRTKAWRAAAALIGAVCLIGSTGCGSPSSTPAPRQVIWGRDNQKASTPPASLRPATRQVIWGH